MKISIWLGLRSINPIWFFDLSGNVFKNVNKIPNYVYSGLRSINPIWFFDLSGNVFKNVNKIPNYVYSAVMYDYIHKKIIPAFEFVTNNHTESNIKIYLSRVKDIYSEIRLSELDPLGYTLINDRMLLESDCRRSRFVIIDKFRAYLTHPVLGIISWFPSKCPLVF